MAIAFVLKPRLGRQPDRPGDCFMALTGHTQRCQGAEHSCHHLRWPSGGSHNKRQSPNFVQKSVFPGYLAVTGARSQKFHSSQPCHTSLRNLAISFLDIWNSERQPAGSQEENDYTKLEQQREDRKALRRRVIFFSAAFIARLLLCLSSLPDSACHPCGPHQ